MTTAEMKENVAPSGRTVLVSAGSKTPSRVPQKTAIPLGETAHVALETLQLPIGNLQQDPGNSKRIVEMYEVLQSRLKPGVVEEESLAPVFAAQVQEFVAVMMSHIRLSLDPQAHFDKTITNAALKFLGCILYQPQLFHHLPGIFITCFMSGSAYNVPI